MECAVVHGCLGGPGHRLVHASIPWRCGHMTRPMERLAKWLLRCSIALMVMPVSAGTLNVRVVDPEGVPVQGIAVFAIYDGSGATAMASAKNVVMDQVDSQFVPHILLVQKGTSIEFPNSDVVAHHVYSFSKPNHFVLPLYKGVAHQPVTFSNDGVVTIGCNIHDEMLAYIVVNIAAGARNCRICDLRRQWRHCHGKRKKRRDGSGRQPVCATHPASAKRNIDRIPEQ